MTTALDTLLRSAGSGEGIGLGTGLPNQTAASFLEFLNRFNPERSDEAPFTLGRPAGAEPSILDILKSGLMQMQSPGMQGMPGSVGSLVGGVAARAATEKLREAQELSAARTAAENPTITAVPGQTAPPPAIQANSNRERVVGTNPAVPLALKELNKAGEFDARKFNLNAPQFDETAAPVMDKETMALALLQGLAAGAANSDQRHVSNVLAGAGAGGLGNVLQARAGQKQQEREVAAENRGIRRQNKQLTAEYDRAKLQHDTAQDQAGRDAANQRRVAALQRVGLLDISTTATKDGYIITKRGEDGTITNEFFPTLQTLSGQKDTRNLKSGDIDFNLIEDSADRAQAEVAWSILQLPSKYAPLKTAYRKAALEQLIEEDPQFQTLRQLDPKEYEFRIKERTFQMLANPQFRQELQRNMSELDAALGR